MFRTAKTILVWGLVLLLTVDAALAGRLFGHCRSESSCCPAPTGCGQCYETSACEYQPSCCGSTYSYSSGCEGCGSCQAGAVVAPAVVAPHPMNVDNPPMPGSPSDQAPPVPTPGPGPAPTPGPAPSLPSEPTPPAIPPAKPMPKPNDDDPFAAPKTTKASRLRVWTDDSGTFQVRAELVQVLDGKVKLLKDNGKFSTVPTDRLSAADLAFVRSQSAVASSEVPSQR